MNLNGKFISKFPSLRCFTYGIATIFIFFITNTAYSQSEKTNHISSPGIRKDSATIDLNTIPAKDSIKKDAVTSPADTSKKKQVEQSLGIRIAKDALPSMVKATSEDSAVADIQHN